ncbi:MAG TPA: Na+/H+ antiporter NhaA [Thermomicrobiales bacterium]|nr:Na+/H+ antiporter NhaA [Thermomicrobiales bacterium]
MSPSGSRNPLDNVRPSPPIAPVLAPFQRFFAVEAAGGILLLVAALTALLWANSPLADSYARVWQIPLSVGVGDAGFAKPLSFWINDGLMAVFFFVIGLEIKRELLVGELASWRQAALPIVAAIGGMVVPAAIYATINLSSAGASGWGIPMATDTAFALGILALLGNRIPLTLRIFLTALAIIDDIGALLVIAFFYTAQISWSGLAITGALLGVLAVVNAVGLRHLLVYAILGVGLWLAVLASGVHPTITGVLLAMLIPASSRIGSGQFLDQARSGLRRFEAAGDRRESVLANAPRQEAFRELMAIAEQAETPLQRLEHRLHPFTTFVVMPLFALANAGLSLGGDLLAILAHPVSVGVVAGLVLGKPLGVAACAWLAVRSGLTTLPDGLSWRHILGVGALAGIGFTMSLFITNLAFGGTELLSTAKLGILAASVVAGLLGWELLRRSPVTSTSADSTVNPPLRRQACPR